LNGNEPSAGIAELIARSDLETNSAITAMRNGINATKPLAERRDSSGMGKLAPSPRMLASASDDPRKAAIMNIVDLVRGDSEVRGAAIAAMAVCAATMKMATAKISKAVPRLRKSGRGRKVGLHHSCIHNYDKGTCTGSFRQ